MLYYTDELIQSFAKQSKLTKKQVKKLRKAIQIVDLAVAAGEDARISIIIKALQQRNTLYSDFIVYCQVEDLILTRELAKDFEETESIESKASSDVLDIMAVGDNTFDKVTDYLLIGEDGYTSIN